MVIYLNANGTIQQIYPEVVTQGSNSQSIVLLTNGISQGSAISVTFELPNGEKLNGGIMIQQDNFVLNDEYVNAYTFDLTKSITNLSGNLKMSFEVLGGGLTTNSYELTVPIIKSIAPVIPTQPSDDEWYAQILEAYNYILQQVNVDIPQDIADAIADHNTSATAHADIRQKIADDIAAHNTSETAHAYIRGLITALGERVTTNEGDISDLKTLTSGHTTEINNIKNGTTVIPTYELKANKITDWEEASNTTYPSAKLVKDTIDAIRKSNGYVFDTEQHFIEWLGGTYTRSDGVVPSDLKIGDDILIEEENTPDYWVSSISTPMTIANFTEYESKLDLSDYLAKDNTTPFTPTGDYNPATKKYVDDKGEEIKGEVDLVAFNGSLSGSKITFTLANENLGFTFENGKQYLLDLKLTPTGVLTDDIAIEILDKDSNEITLTVVKQLGESGITVGDLRQIQNLDTNYKWFIDVLYLESGSPLDRRFVTADVIKESVCSMTGDELLDAITNGTLNPNTVVVVTANSTDNDTTYEVGHIYRVNVTYVQDTFTFSTSDITTGGGSGATGNYEELTNLPTINNVTLIGSKTSADLGIVSNLIDGTGEKSARQVKTGTATYESEFYGTTPYFNIALLNDYLEETYPVTNNEFEAGGVTYTINQDATSVSGNGNTYTISQRSFKIPINNKNTQLWLKYSGATITYVSEGEEPGAYGKFTAMLNGRSLAIGEYATSMGQSSIAYGIRSVALNTKNVSYGQNTFTQGALGVAEGQEAAAFNYHNYAKGKFSFATGAQTKAVGDNSATFGMETEAKGKFSMAAGYASSTSAEGNSQVALGRETQSNGVATISAGINTRAEENASIAIGTNTVAGGRSSVAEGGATKTLFDKFLYNGDGSGSGGNPAPQGPQGLVSGRRYRFHGTMPTGEFEEWAWSIGCSSVENLDIPTRIIKQNITSQTISFGGGWMLYETQPEYSYLRTTDKMYGGLNYDNYTGQQFYGAFNFVYDGTYTEEGTLTDDEKAQKWAEIMTHIDEHPAVELKKGSMYHFEGTIPNTATVIPFSKIAGITTTSTKQVDTGSAWEFTQGHLYIGDIKYETFTGGFDFVYDGSTTIALTGQYAEYSELIRVAAHSVDGHNAHAQGAGTEAFGHAAHASGILSKAYGHAAISEGSDTQAGVLVNYIVYDKADGTDASNHAKTYSVPSVKNTHAGGLGTKAIAENQAVFGKYNKTNSNALFQIGNGASNADDERATAFEVLADGRAKVSGTPTENDDVVRKTDMETAITNATISVYKIQGSETVTNLNNATKVASMNGYVYNISTGGTLNNQDATTVTVVAGDNVLFVWNNGTWYWDKLAGDFEIPIKSISARGTVIQPDANGNVNIPGAQYGVLGLCKTNRFDGIESVYNDIGYIRLSPAPTDWIDNKGSQYPNSPITTSNYTYAVGKTFLQGSSAPTTSTVADFVGQLYVDTTNSKTYQCFAMTSDGGNPATITYTWEEITHKNYVDTNFAKVDASNLSSANISSWKTALNFAELDASNLSSTNIASWKTVLNYTELTTVYDKASNDSAINWGYTSGINASTEVTNKDFSDYKYLIITCGDNRSAGNPTWETTIILDLTTTKDSSSDYYASGITASQDNSSNFYKIVASVKVNSAKTSIELKFTGLDNSGNGFAQTSSSNMSMLKIMGVK